MALLQLLATTALALASVAVQAGPLWKNVEYGMSLQQVQSAVPAGLAPEKPSTLTTGEQEMWRLESRRWVGNDDYRVSFFFTQDKLKKVVVRSNEQLPFEDLLVRFNAISTEFRKQYGAEQDRQIKTGTMDSAVATWRYDDVSIRVAALAVKSPSYLTVVFEHSDAAPTKPTQVATATGPFGLRMGMTKLELHAGKQLEPFKYELSSVPKPHAAFESYVAEVTPKAGLCYLKGVGKDIQSNVYGVEIKTQFANLKNQLTQNYGEPEVIDTLLPGSIWNEPNEWLMALRKNERTLIAIWKKENGAPLKGGVRVVYLGAGANRGDSGYVSVDYEFDNKDQCEAEEADDQRSAL